MLFDFVFVCIQIKLSLKQTNGYAISVGEDGNIVCNDYPGVYPAPPVYGKSWQ